MNLGSIFGNISGSSIMNIVIIVLGIALVGFILVRLFFWKQVRHFLGKEDEKKIDAMRLCEDRVARDIKLKVTRYCGEITKERKAWYGIHKVLIPDIGKRKNFLLITERDNVPLDLFNTLSPEERRIYQRSKFDKEGFAVEPYTGITKVCYDASFDVQQTAAIEDKNRNMGTIASIIALMFACIFGIMMLINYFGSH